MGITLIVIKGKSIYDMSSLVQTATWSGKKSAMPRTLELTMLDSDRAKQARPDIDIEEGQKCLFGWNGRELFRGMFVNSSQASARSGTYRAYDLGMYLAKNMGTFTYKKKTGTEIFKDICKKFDIPYEAVDTGYAIPDLTMTNTSAADVVWKALAKTYKAKGKRHYILAKGDKLCLISRGDNVLKLVVEEGANVINFTRQRSIENTYTRVKIYSDANKVLATAKDTKIEAKLGIMQYSEQFDKESKANVDSTAKSLLKIKKQTEETVEAEIIGDVDVYSGMAVYLTLPYLGINKAYYVDEDEHTFKGELHTMRLKLNAINDVEGADDADKD